MCPDACWDRFRDCLADGNDADAFHALCDLDMWCIKGGFAPRGVSKGQIRTMASNAKRTVAASEKLSEDFA